MWVSKLTISLVAAIFLLIAVYSTASAREITVDNNDSGAEFKSIQEAVNNSSSGDIILVYPGFYNESVNIVIQNNIPKVFMIYHILAICFFYASNPKSTLLQHGFSFLGNWLTKESSQNKLCIGFDWMP